MTIDTRLDKFVTELQVQLQRRFDKCNDAATTPSTILFDVLRAVEDARGAAGI
jgi:hypothetical protein